MNTETSPLAKLHKRLYAVVYLANFHAQVVSAYFQDYQEKAFAVAEQLVERHKTTIIASSDQAQLNGVFPGMAIHEIDRGLLKNVTIIPRSKKLEKDACADIMGAIEGLTPYGKKISENEYLLDLTGTPAVRRGGPKGAGIQIQECLKTRPGFTEVAVGMAHSKICARVMAKKYAPMGIYVGDSSNCSEFLAAEIAFLPNLTAAEKEKLQKIGVVSIRQVRNMGRGILRKLFGRNGERLFAASMGLDLEMMAEPSSEIEEIEILSVDVNDLDELYKIVLRVVDRVFDKIQQRKQLVASLLLTIIYGDNQKSETRIEFPNPTNRIVDSKLFKNSFLEIYTRRVALRSVGVRVKKYQPDHGQLLLFEPTNNKIQKVTEAVSEIRKSFGFDAIVGGDYFGVSKITK